MSDSDDPKTWPELANRLMDGPIGLALKVVVGVVAFIIVVASFRAFSIFMSHPEDVFQSSTKDCLHLEEVGGRIFKIDQCKKTVEPLEIAPLPPSATPPSPPSAAPAAP